MPEDRSALIPTEIYAEYHKRYHNHSYREFSQQLALHIPADGDEHIRIMNGLIDCSFQRLGAERYRDACSRLAHDLLRFQDDTLFICAEAHLAAFTINPENRDALLTAGLLELLHEQIGTASSQAHQMQVLAASHHRQPGRVAYYWLTGIIYLLIALRAVLQDDADAERRPSSYVREKLTVAVSQIASGLTEITLADRRLKSAEHD